MLWIPFLGLPLPPTTPSSPTHTGCDHPCLHLHCHPVWNHVPFPPSRQPIKVPYMLHEVFPNLSAPLFSFPDYPSIFCETRHRNYTVFGLPSWRFWGYLSAKGRHGPSARTSASPVWCGGKEWNGVYLVFANPVSTVHHGRGLYWNSILHCLILSNCREFRVLMAVLIEVQILKG